MGYEPGIRVEIGIEVEAAFFLLSLRARLLKRNGLGESRLVRGQGTDLESSWVVLCHSLRVLLHLDLQHLALADLRQFGRLHAASHEVLHRVLVCYFDHFFTDVGCVDLVGSSSLDRLHQFGVSVSLPLLACPSGEGPVESGVVGLRGSYDHGLAEVRRLGLGGLDLKDFLGHGHCFDFLG